MVGGIKQWAEAVVERFKSFGGEILLGARVEEVMIDNGKVKGVAISEPGKGKREVLAPVVVSNIPTQDTFVVADKKKFPTEWADRTEKLRGFGSIAPYFGLNKLVLPEFEWDKGMKDTLVIPKGSRLTHDVYMCWNIQSVSDPALRAPGQAPFHRLRPGDPGRGGKQGADGVGLR